MNTLENFPSYHFSAWQLSQFRQVGEFKGRQELMIRQQPEVLDTLRQIAVLESVEYSNHLDHIMVPRDTARKLAQYQYKPVTPMDRQVAGYRDALNLVVDPSEHLTLSVSFIRQLHAMLYAHVPHEGGRWRATNKDILERDENGKRIGILYQTVPASGVDKAMESMVSRYHQELEKGTESLLLVAFVVLDFLCIHPFSDGNGRIARLLMLLMLAHSGYQVGQLISIERVLASDEGAYLKSLKLSVKGWHESKHTPMPWLDFFLSVLVKAYDEMESKITDLQWQGVRAPKSQLIKTAIDRAEASFSIADICVQIPTVSRELVKKVVQQLRTEGDLESVGKGRGAQWRKTVS
ncbi:hypothetical protein ACH42_02735 [Endozoicomonas sp. (ex Bugula neritina AB1)]|nr:hypothetical protein ACH42_02735 [Endozoicomonas sp. (ex Bugula neritina AB1)]